MAADVETFLYKDACAHGHLPERYFLAQHTNRLLARLKSVGIPAPSVTVYRRNAGPASERVPGGLFVGLHWPQANVLKVEVRPGGNALCVLHETDFLEETLEEATLLRVVSKMLTRTNV
jgi:hypothetical protein